MKSSKASEYIFLIAVAFVTTLSQYCTPVNKANNIAMQKVNNELLTGFLTPPDSTKPFVYWYWISDNISREGITKDLEAMARVGIGEAFIGNIGLDDEPYGNVKVLSDEWWSLTEHAIREGKRLGVNIGMFNSPGWSQSGGPWVKPSEAMRYLVSTDTIVQGGQIIRINLPAPKDTFQDVKVLAYPQPLYYNQAVGKNSTTILVNGKADPNMAALVDGKLNAVTIPVTGNKLTLDIVPAQPFEARSIAIHPAALRFLANIELKAFVDGKYRTIQSFNFDRSNANPGVGPMHRAPVAIGFDAVTASKFQLVFTNIIVTGPKKDEIALTEIQLQTAPVLDRFIEKQLGVMYQTPLPYWKEYQWVTQPTVEPENSKVMSQSVVDVSKYMQPNGTFVWNVPAGNWIISRIGVTPTGTKNSPTSPEAQGLEVDKMSATYLSHHFDAYIGEILRRMPAADRSAFKHVVADSYEMGPENWTEGLQQDFIKKYGYDPIPYLPVMNGTIINSADQSDRFLWDLRRLIADKVAYEYVGGLRKQSEKNGLRVWLENYGHWGFPSEFLMYGGQSNDIGGEFWNEGTLGNVECKAASSAAHTYGVNRVYAESFTASGKSFERDPAYLKKRGDWSFTEGINHVLLHVYIHQPYEDKYPGMNAWFGTEFNRKNTWFEQSKYWIDYLRRCMFMLQQGKQVSDVCYFIGEDAPKMTGIREPELPKGYSYDYINAEVILNRMQVQNGKLVLPDGMSYSMMVLPPLTTMRPAVLNKIMQLVNDGATILGAPPTNSPSLQGYPTSDAEIKSMAATLWGNINGTSIRSHRYGKGRVLQSISMQAAFDSIGVAKDLAVPANVPVLFTHRTTNNVEIYFITNQSDSIQTFNASFRVSGKKPELWNAVSGTTEIVPSYTMQNGQTTFAIKMQPAQSYFVVFQQPATGSVVSSNERNATVIQTLNDPWNVQFDHQFRGPKNPVNFTALTDWTKNTNDSIKFYSGTATYQTSFNFNGLSNGKYTLDLGNVKNLAKITLNGKKLGGLWMAPWQLDISSALQNGVNTLQVEVVNVWVNRLIGDAALPENQRQTWASVNSIKAKDPLHASGLLGPVTIISK